MLKEVGNLVVTVFAVEVRCLLVELVSHTQIRLPLHLWMITTLNLLKSYSYFPLLSYPEKSVWFVFLSSEIVVVKGLLKVRFRSSYTLLVDPSKSHHCLAVPQLNTLLIEINSLFHTVYLAKPKKDVVCF